MIRDYTEILKRGEKNAISAKLLCKLVGVPSVRDLQHDISKSRAAGQVILSSTRTGGYYLPENRAEVEAFVQTLKNRAFSTLKALRSAKRFLKEWPDQQELKADEDGQLILW